MKFKVGDKVRHKDSEENEYWTIVRIDDDPRWPIDVDLGDGSEGSESEDELDLVERPLKVGDTAQIVDYPSAEKPCPFWNGKIGIITAVWTKRDEEDQYYSIEVSDEGWPNCKGKGRITGGFETKYIKPFLLETNKETLDAIVAEVQSARIKFPKNEHLVHALLKEAGEVAKAYLQGEPLENIYKEACQVAAAAVRIMEEGDSDFDVDK